eukprot:6214513-Pleurochrysis_carterae.AAC.3
MARVSPNTQLVDDVCQSWFTDSSESENEGMHRTSRNVSTTLRAPIHAGHSISARANVHEVPEVGVYVPSASTINDKADAGESWSEAPRVGSGISAVARGKEHSGRRGGRKRRHVGSRLLCDVIGVVSIGLSW